MSVPPDRDQQTHDLTQQLRHHAARLGVGDGLLAVVVGVDQLGVIHAKEMQERGRRFTMRAAGQ